MSQTTSRPATGLPPGVETGPLGKRLVAQLIDLSVPLVIGIAASAAIGQATEGVTALSISLVGWLLVAAWSVLLWWMYATRAAGPGMRAMRLQLVGLRNGRPIGWSRFLVRSLVLAGLTVTVVGLVLLLIFLARNPRKQGWHDLVAESVVIKQRVLAVRKPEADQGPASAAALAQQARRATPAASRRVADPPSGSGPAAPGQSRPADTAPLPNDPAAPKAGVGGASPVPTPTPGEDSVRVRPRRSSAVDAPPSAPEVTPTANDGRPLDQGWVAVLDDGREVPVTGLVMLGRNPQARAGEDDAELIKVADDTRTVSKTHLSLKVDANGLFVMDRGSTNGTTLTNVVGVSRPCPAGDIVSVSEGAIVSFGDHWLKIERRFDR